MILKNYYNKRLMLDFTLKKIDCIACEKLKMQGIKLTMRQKKSRVFFGTVHLAHF
jgi:hypothetical protein